MDGTNTRLRSTLLASVPASVQHEYLRFFNDMTLEIPEMLKHLKRCEGFLPEPTGPAHSFPYEDQPMSYPTGGSPPKRGRADRPSPSPCPACNCNHWRSKCSHREAQCANCEITGHTKDACQSVVKRDAAKRIDSITMYRPSRIVIIQYAAIELMLNVPTRQTVPEKSSQASCARLPRRLKSVVTNVTVIPENPK